LNKRRKNEKKNKRSSDLNKRRKNEKKNKKSSKFNKKPNYSSGRM